MIKRFCMKRILGAVVVAGALWMTSGCATPAELRKAVAGERSRAQEELAELALLVIQLWAMQEVGSSGVFSSASGRSH